MGPLSDSWERIVQFTLNSVVAMKERMAERKVGEMVFVSDGAGKRRRRRAMVLNCLLNRLQ